MAEWQVTQIDHVSVIITDVERSRRFYGDLLGLRDVEKKALRAERLDGLGGLVIAHGCEHAPAGRAILPDEFETEAARRADD